MTTEPLDPGHNTQRKRAADLVDLEQTAAYGVIEREPAAGDYIERAVVHLDGASVQVQRDGDAVHATRGHGRVCQHPDRLAVFSSRKCLVERRVLDAVNARNHPSGALGNILIEREYGCLLLGRPNCRDGLLMRIRHGRQKK